MPDDVQSRTTANRRAVADLFAGLDDDQLDAPSLCAGWRCRDVLGHLVMTLDLSFPGFLREVLRDRGRAGETSDRLARSYADQPVDRLVETLRRRSSTALAPPGVGLGGPFTDSCIHLRDVAIPLAITTTPPVSDWARVLDFLTTPRARRAGFLPRGRLDGLALVATDSPWTGGSGALVTGTSEALALSITGRPVLLAHLEGDGATTLSDRVRAALPR
ncbi:maleylpyruvate isomerase family mycothiol-dependent enzyme [uncultured Pseudokineococcus sp.]|uniref:maleylpyruvate isomerase family mycothiol-dependent enzyme n=1 Tax=uncultured Pseudokineococcus sp. TaxID=1642928 RepID=UPI00262631F0|nr:maleylpyruvate isomerase family mycothiol-dependent enzyme [uncultured Pseudokineococcus sp.]